MSDIDLNEAYAVLEASASIHVKKIAFNVGLIILMTLSCGNVTQIMTRNL